MRGNEMNTKVYVIAIEDGKPPAIKQIEDVGSVTVMGQSYWLVPMALSAAAESVLVPTAAETVPIDANEIEELERQVRDLVSGGLYSVERMARELKTSSYVINGIIKAHKLEAPADRIRRRFRIALSAAGDEGLLPSELSRVAGSPYSAGPILAAMMRHGEITRLEDGRWAKTSRT